MTIRILVIDDELARLAYKREEFLARWNLFPGRAFARAPQFTFISSQHVLADRIDNDAQLAVEFVAEDPEAWSMVLLDMQFDHGELVNGEPRRADPRFGLKIQALLEREFPELPILQFTAQMHADLAHEGGYYLSKIDGTTEDLRNQLIERGRLSLEDRRLLLRIPADTIIASDATVKAYAQVHRLAATNAALLIVGETGTGKTHLARYFHDMSPHASGPWVVMEMTSKPDNLFEALLFGHEKGAFTGADRFSPGLFSEAEGGTLFLDEIGALPPQLQAKMLRAVGERRYRRIGAAQDQELRCQLVAATQDPIDADASRKDLWARFQTVSIPPLRERPQEIGKLAEHFLAISQKKQAKKGMKFSAVALATLAGQPWPDNSRGLENMVQNAVLRLSSNSVVQLRDLDLVAPATPPKAHAQATASPSQAHEATISPSSPVVRLADLLASMDEAAIPDTDEALRGLLSRFDDKSRRVRQELMLAAMHRCRHKVSGKVNLLASMRFLTNDAALSSTDAKRDLKMAFGLTTKGPVDREWLERLLQEWVARKYGSHGP
ncbi:sigma-54 dependent transcriptional regulator [Polaromonas sp.]|uniref:sigma-54-dependent transcriptional regulator n=1 Tax=Polaromonas sp. TaxID=1869339 RepID=UPI002731D3DB|nr:sigma 54-interacting transcriptional regulator [Polaromonas sp.]MDP1740945.1 sigma 54-interacting transcriptional regulator [Polaromonas sp.]